MRDSRGTYRFGSLISKASSDVFLAASEQAGLPLAQDLVNTAVLKPFLSSFAPVGSSFALATRDTVLQAFPDAIETANG